jgi:leucyl aminopeptidase
VGQARTLANTPPNVANPEWLADQAKTEGRRRHARVRVLEGRDLEKRGCGGLLAVGGGSATPPRMVVLEWSATAPRARVAIVGKGVTFDTGGYSIKPGQGLEEMKYDKCGACTALAVALAAIDAEIAIDLSVYLPLAENAIDGAAYRPGDIVRHPNGVTTEIHNTDAEGRLILADALCLAAEAKPDYLVELSTLTGACVIALGHTRAGLWTPSDELAGALDTAATSAGERVWRMPLDLEDREAMDGTHADAKNLGPREASASSAAQFLGRFVGEVPRWAHLDIAGVAFGGEASKAAGGATGWGVATLLHWLRQVASEPSIATTSGGNSL